MTPAGGFLVAPEQFVARLIQDLDNMVWVRQLATVLTLTGAESIGVPTLETDISDTNWTTELSIGTADTSMAFGKRRLTPHPLAKSIKVSNRPAAKCGYQCRSSGNVNGWATSSAQFRKRPL